MRRSLARVLSPSPPSPFVEAMPLIPCCAKRRTLVGPRPQMMCQARVRVVQARCPIVAHLKHRHAKPKRRIDDGSVPRAPAMVSRAGPRRYPGSGAAMWRARSGVGRRSVNAICPMCDALKPSCYSKPLPRPVSSPGRATPRTRNPAWAAGFRWWAVLGSNQRPPACKADSRASVRFRQLPKPFI